MADRTANGRKPANEIPVLSGQDAADIGSRALSSGDARAPRIAVRAQYVKDLSFENPHAPESLMEPAGSPQIRVDVRLESKSLGSDLYEVVLRIEASARRDDRVVFLVEVAYGGAFMLEHIPRERARAVCMVECARLLFPFARHVIADATREGGFPPLFLDPIDFARLYRGQQAAARAAKP